MGVPGGRRDSVRWKRVSSGHIDVRRTSGPDRVLLWRMGLDSDQHVPN